MGLKFFQRVICFYYIAIYDRTTFKVNQYRL